MDKYTIGEEIFEKLLETENPLLALEKVARKKGRKTPDFFIRNAESIIGVCEIKDLEDPDHHSVELTTEYLNSWAKRQEKLEAFMAKGEGLLTKAEKGELEQLKIEEQEDQEKDKNHSERLLRAYRGQIDEKYRKALLQLSGYHLPRIIVFVSFNMADVFDLRNYLREPHQEDLHKIDLCVWLNVNKGTGRSKTINLTKAGLIFFTKTGDALLNGELFFFRELEPKLPLKLYL